MRFLILIVLDSASVLMLTKWHDKAEDTLLWLCFGNRLG